MPTGYTDAIKDGISFKTFALNCARAFGACVSLRDAPVGGEQIPYAFKPSSYHVEEVERAKSALEALEKLTPEQCDERALMDWTTAVSSHKANLERKRALRVSYEAMLSKVNAWVPPTVDHNNLHHFMREQLQQSIDFDCDERFFTEPAPRLTGEEWRERERIRLADGIAYHEAQHADEVKRAADRTAWVQALRDSLEDRD